MINGFAILLVFQVLGELVAHIWRLPVPGPICGMVLLLGSLIWRGEQEPEELGQASSGLLANLGLLFVPAGVGVMSYWGLLSQDWFAIAAALVVSTLAAIATTALVAVEIARRQASTTTNHQLAAPDCVGRSPLQVDPLVLSRAKAQMS